MNSPARTAYLAPEGFAAELAQEIGPVDFAHDRLLIASGPLTPAAWAQNSGKDCHCEERSDDAISVPPR